VKKQTHTLVVLGSLLFCLGYLFNITTSDALASSLGPWNLGIDLTYEKTTDTTQAPDTPDEKSVDVNQEYRLLHNASLSLDTKISTELRATVERDNQEPEPDTSLYKPYADFQMKSRLYNFELGYQGSDEQTDITQNTDEGFFNFTAQPEYLPELDVKYDFKSDVKSGDPKIYYHNISVNSLYNIQDFLRVRLDYEGQVTDYHATPESLAGGTDNKGDIEEGDLLGQVTLKQFLLNNKLRFSLDYKAEKEDEKYQDLINDPNHWTKGSDQFIQITNSQITYAITPGTTLNAQYENKHTRGQVDPQNTTSGTEQENDFRMDLSQKICSYMTALGKYRSEKNQDESQNESVGTYEAEIDADPQKWLNLRAKLTTEARNTDGLEDNTLDKKEDTRTIEGSWDADLSQFLNARNTFDVKLMKEKTDGLDSSRENDYRWRLQLTPIVNLTVTPEYDVSNEKVYGPELTSTTNNNTLTRERRLEAAYALAFSPYLKANLSHSLSRKRMEGDEPAKENNDDTKLDISFIPTQAITLSSQIIREDKRTFQNGDLTEDELDTSYALNYDWRFDPFTWSSSFKYDNRSGETSEGDTETVESGLTYKLKQNYDFTTNYKYTKTYSDDNPKEIRISFELRAYF
jgi:hypothetical protein